MSPRTKALIRAQEKYDRNNTIRVSIKLIKTTDGDIIKYLDKTPSKAGAFKEAIREKMARESEG